MNRTDIVACIHKHLGQPDDLENLLALADEIARIAAEAEREECARVCIDQGAYRDEIEMAMECAWAIRQRSNDTEKTMAELMLTEEEKAAALWSDIDNAALGKLVKKKISFLTDAAAQLDRVTTFAAAMLLCCAAAEQNASELALEIDGLTQEGREFGDWRVVAMKTAKG